MQTATILHMEDRNEQSDREDRSTLKDVKRQMDRLTGEVGKLVVALQGDDLGNEGVLPRIQAIEKQQWELKKRFDEMELAQKKKEMYVMAIIGLAGIVLGSLIKTLIDHLIPIKK